MQEVTHGVCPRCASAPRHIKRTPGLALENLAQQTALPPTRAPTDIWTATSTEHRWAEGRDDEEAAETSSEALEEEGVPRLPSPHTAAPVCRRVTRAPPHVTKPSPGQHRALRAASPPLLRAHRASEKETPRVHVLQAALAWRPATPCPHRRRVVRRDWRATRPVCTGADVFRAKAICVGCCNGEAASEVPGKVPTRAQAWLFEGAHGAP